MKTNDIIKEIDSKALKEISKILKKHHIPYKTCYSVHMDDDSYISLRIATDPKYDKVLDDLLQSLEYTASCVDLECFKYGASYACGPVELYKVENNTAIYFDWFFPKDFELLAE